jgi:hypothetical protein
MAAASDSLSQTFNGKAVQEFLEFGFKAVVFGLLIGGVVDFTLFHEHPIGHAILDAVREPLLASYDWIAHATGFSEYARAADFLGLAGAPITDPGLALSSAADATDLIPDVGCAAIDPLTAEPMC